MGVVIVNNKPNTFYVDDDNIMGPWFGTEEQPFRYIQSAIDSCGARFDKVIVNPGIYYESISIGEGRSVSLHGMDKHHTIITGSPDKTSGVGVISSKFNSIDGFTISNFLMGMYVINSHFNRIFNNIILDNKLVGISVTFTVGNMFYDNNFLNTTSYNVMSLNSVNFWYNPFRLRGNYWDDYENRYPDASPRAILKNCWDTPYIVGQMWQDLPIAPPSFLRFFWNNDRFPLINQ
jgi:parallel beta-helix repeat protein